MLSRKRPRTRRWSYGLALAGAALTIIVLGVLFSVSANPQITQPPQVELPPTAAPSPPTPTAAPSPPTPTAQPMVEETPPVATPVLPLSNLSGVLLVESHTLFPDTEVSQIIGAEFHVLTALSFQPRMTFENNYSATQTTLLAPDKSRLYMAEMDTVDAIDVATWEPLWNTPMGASMYHDTLTTSPDGRWLYAPVSPADMPESESMNIRLQILDTTTGQILPERIDLPSCGVITFFRPLRGDAIYFTCTEKMYRLNTSTQQAEQIPFPINASRAVLSPDGRLLYNFAHDMQMKLQIVDLEQATIVHEETIVWQDHSLIFNSAQVAFSGDGSTFVVGVRFRDADEQPGPSQFQVFDAGTWQRKTVFDYAQPFNLSALAMSADGSTIYTATQTSQGKPGPYHQLVAFDAGTGQVKAAGIREYEDIQQIVVP